MKKTLSAALSCNAKTPQGDISSHHDASGFYYLAFPVGLLFSLLLSAFIFAGCAKQSLTEPSGAAISQNGLNQLDAVNGEDITTSNLERGNGNMPRWYDGLRPLTIFQLLQARAATARYRDINKAIADGYTNINVDVENMGHHYMKPDLVDGVFDVRKPEILVYHEMEDGSMELGAVEYAVPLSEPEPEGFAGSKDVWDGNTTFQLWLLHAWVWTYNPDGVFNPLNPLVHLH